MSHHNRGYNRSTYPALTATPHRSSSAVCSGFAKPLQLQLYRAPALNSPPSLHPIGAVTRPNVMLQGPMASGTFRAALRPLGHKEEELADRSVYSG